MPWSEYEKKLSSKSRYTLRRARKRAEERGSVHMEILSPTVDNIEQYLEEIFRVESLSWKEQDGASMSKDSELRRFFFHYTHSALRQRTLRIGFLRINSTVVAFQIAVEFSKRYWVLKIGYDESYAQCSPGVLLMHEAIQYAFDKKLEAFEFMGYDEQWLHMWTDEMHHFTGIHTYPISFKGLVNLGSDTSSYLLNRIPPVKRLLTNKRKT